MSHECLFQPQNNTFFRCEVLSGWKYADFQTFAHVSVGQRFSCLVLHKRLSLSARKGFFVLPESLSGIAIMCLSSVRTVLSVL